MLFSIQNTTCTGNVNEKLSEFKNRFNIVFSQVFEELTGLDITSMSFTELEPQIVNLEESLINLYLKNKRLYTLEAVCTFLQNMSAEELALLNTSLKTFFLGQKQVFSNWVFVAIFDSPLSTKEFQKDFGIAVSLYQDVINLFETYDNGKFTLNQEDRLKIYSLSLEISSALVTALDSLPDLSQNEKEDYLREVAGNPFYRNQELDRIENARNLYSTLKVAVSDRLGKICDLKSGSPTSGKKTILLTTTSVLSVILAFKLLKK